jgi:hypothetical protein
MFRGVAVGCSVGSLSGSLLYGILTHSPFITPIFGLVHPLSAPSPSLPLFFFFFSEQLLLPSLFYFLLILLILYVYLFFLPPGNAAVSTIEAIKHAAQAAGKSLNS